MKTYLCDNCLFETTNPDKITVKLDACEGLNERLDPTGVVPYGECPMCRCFIYEVEEEQASEGEPPEHTPGPWAVITAYPGIRHPHEPKCHLKVVEADDSDLVVCRFYGTSPQNLQEARLISAAPELLELCRAAVRREVEVVGDPESPFAVDEAYLAQLRAAIAKATCADPFPR